MLTTRPPKPLSFPNSSTETTRVIGESSYRHLSQLVAVSNGPVDLGLFADVCSLFSGPNFLIMSSEFLTASLSETQINK
jgi:hypothetical protein